MSTNQNNNTCTYINTFQPLFIIHVCILLYDGQISSSKDTKSSSHIPCNVTMSIHVPQLCLSSITSSCLGKDNSKPGFCTIDNLHQLDCCPYESNRQHKLFFLEMMDAKGAVWCGTWHVLKHLQWKELEELVNCKDAFVACSRCSNREAEQRDAIRKNSKGVG